MNTTENEDTAFLDSTPQTDQQLLSELQSQLQSKDAQIATLNAKVELLEKTLSNRQSYMSYEILKDSDTQIQHYTGLADCATFRCLLEFYLRFSTTDSTSWSVMSVSTENQLLITLLKLRHNFAQKHLGFSFNLSTATVTKITCHCIDILHELVFVGILKAVGIPSRQKILFPCLKLLKHFLVHA